MIVSKYISGAFTAVLFLGDLAWKTKLGTFWRRLPPKHLELGDPPKWYCKIVIEKPGRTQRYPNDTPKEHVSVSNFRRCPKPQESISSPKSKMPGIRDPHIAFSYLPFLVLSFSFLRPFLFFPLLVLSSSFPLPFFFLSFSSLLPFLFLSSFFPFPVLFVSLFFPLSFFFLSSFLPLPFFVLSSSLPLPLLFLSPLLICFSYADLCILAQGPEEETGKPRMKVNEANQPHWIAANLWQKYRLR